MRTTSPTPAVGARADGAPATANGAGAGYLLLFVAAAYALAWLPFAVPILAARGVLARPAPDVVFITLATLGVCLAGVGAAAAESGRTGVRALLAGVPLWRVRPAWYAAAVLVPALFPAGGFLLGLALGEPVPPAPPPGVWLSLPLLLVALTVPALLEEIGCAGTPSRGCRAASARCRRRWSSAWSGRGCTCRSGCSRTSASPGSPCPCTSCR